MQSTASDFRPEGHDFKPTWDGKLLTTPLDLNNRAARRKFLQALLLVRADNKIRCKWCSVVVKHQPDHYLYHFSSSSGSRCPYASEVLQHFDNLSLGTTLRLALRLESNNAKDNYLRKRTRGARDTLQHDVGASSGHLPSSSKYIAVDSSQFDPALSMPETGNVIHPGILLKRRQFLALLSSWFSEQGISDLAVNNQSFQDLVHEYFDIGFKVEPSMLHRPVFRVSSFSGDKDPTFYRIYSDLEVIDSLHQVVVCGSCMQSRIVSKITGIILVQYEVHFVCDTIGRTCGLNAHDDFRMNRVLRWATYVDDELLNLASLMQNDVDS